MQITENDFRILKRIQQLYYDGMYGDLYKKQGTEFPCDKYCENFMKSGIDDLVEKIEVELKK